MVAIGALVDVYCNSLFILRVVIKACYLDASLILPAWCAMCETDKETHGIPKYPTISNRYVIDAIIGSGAMGQRFSGRDTKLGRKVTLKIAPSGRDVTRQTLEAEALAKLNFGQVVQVFDIENMNGSQTLIVMELAEGCDLACKNKANNFTQPKALSF